jgi:uncharacterized membrane protein
LTRVRLRNRFVTTTIIFNLIALSLLIYHQLNISHVDLWVLVPYLLFLVFLWTRARLLKSRVAELVDLAAHRAGLQRVTRRGKVGMATSTPVVEASTATDAVSPHLPG